VIRYRYVTQIHPPGPFVSVSVGNPVNGAEQRDFPAQLDSAADRTVLPAAVVQTLVLPQIGAILMGGITGAQLMPSYPVQLAIHNLPPQTVEVVASASESWVLVGRDILNSHRCVLDGPQLFLEIS